MVQKKKALLIVIISIIGVQLNKLENSITHALYDVLPDTVPFIENIQKNQDESSSILERSNDMVLELIESSLFNVHRFNTGANELSNLNQNPKNDTLIHTTKSEDNVRYEHKH